MELKQDIVKALETLEWPLLLKVLTISGFHNQFVHWVRVILSSERLSIILNGSPHCYINCEQGVRQGDPLSPVLFCIMEEVLSRGILLIRQEGKLGFITSPRGVQAPSLVFYAGDLIIFCRATMKGIEPLLGLVERYGNMLGQIVS